MRKFYDDRTNWMLTWNGEDAALQVDYIKVYQYVGDGGTLTIPIVSRKGSETLIQLLEISVQLRLTRLESDTHMLCVFTI